MDFGIVKTGKEMKPENLEDITVKNETVMMFVERGSLSINWQSENP